MEFRGTFGRGFGGFLHLFETEGRVKAMSFEILMGTFAVGIAAMLTIMGSRQWKMGYRVAGGLSLVVAVAIVVTAAWALLTFV